MVFVYGYKNSDKIEDTTSENIQINLMHIIDTHFQR